MLRSQSNSIRNFASRQLEAVIVAPADPGNLGDEAMMHGMRNLLRGCRITILNDSGNTLWKARLALQQGQSDGINERPGPLAKSRRTVAQADVVAIIGADLIDGTCGIPFALERIALAQHALQHARLVTIACSFRSDADPQIIAALRRLQGAVFLLRDAISLKNFKSQVGLPCEIAPDLSLFYVPQLTQQSSMIAGVLPDLKPEQPLIGLNFSEQCFRSFYDSHTQAARESFVAEVIAQLLRHVPEAQFLLMSNDNRSWPNHPSDDDFAALAREEILHQVGSKYLIASHAPFTYEANITLLKSAQLVVTGRMHLAMAAIRAGCRPLILMSKGRGYTSIDKMRGALATNLGDDSGVIAELNQLGSAAASALQKGKEDSALFAVASENRQAWCEEFRTKFTQKLHEQSNKNPHPGLAVRLASALLNMISANQK